MASTNTNKTIIAVGIVGIIGYLVYKATPALAAKLKGGSASNGGAVGGAAASDYYPHYNPDYPRAPQAGQSGMPSLSANFGPKSSASGSTYAGNQYANNFGPSAQNMFGPSQMDKLQIPNDAGIYAGMDADLAQQYATDYNYGKSGQAASDMNSYAYSPDFPGTELNSPSNNFMTTLFNSIWAPPDVVQGDPLDASLISADQAQQYSDYQDTQAVNSGDAQAAIDAVNGYAYDQGDFSGYDSFPGGGDSGGGDDGGY